MPNSTMPTITSVVVIGRWMKSSEIPRRAFGSAFLDIVKETRSRCQQLASSSASRHPLLHLFEVQINDRSEIKRHDLRHHQTADHSQSQSAPGSRPGAPTERDW